MDKPERVQILRRILARKFIFTFEGPDGVDHRGLYCDPSLDILVEADYEYQTAYQTNLDIPTLKETYDILADRGDWGEEDEYRISVMQRDMDALKKQLSFLQFQKTQQRATQNRIREIGKQLNKLSNRKYQLLDISRENYCLNLQKRFIISKCVTFDDGFKIPSNSIAFTRLIVLIDRENDKVTESAIREIARTSPFRGMWRACQETGNTLFHHSTSEMSELQQALLDWVGAYDYAYNHTKRPPESIINDDVAFDAWYENEVRQLENDIGKRFNENKVRSNHQSGGIQELFIPADEEGAKEVYKLNDSMTRRKIRQRQEYIAQKGNVNDKELPDVKKFIQMEANKQSIESRRK